MSHRTVEMEQEKQESIRHRPDLVMDVVIQGVVLLNLHRVGPAEEEAETMIQEIHHCLEMCSRVDGGSAKSMKLSGSPVNPLFLSGKVG